MGVRREQPPVVDQHGRHSAEDPEEADPDELYDHIQEKYDDDIWQTAYTVSRAAQHIIDEVGVTDRVAECENVGEFFYRWATTSRTTFFREIVMEASYKDSRLGYAPVDVRVDAEVPTVQLHANAEASGSVQ